jgi:exopolysaccharide biosynthesis polyprenyl glycosylphosphotransferase
MMEGQSQRLHAIGRAGEGWAQTSSKSLAWPSASALSILPLVLADAFLSAACLFAAFQLKFHYEAFFEFGRTWSSPGFQPYLQLMIFAPFVRLSCSYWVGAYRVERRTYHLADDVIQLTAAVVLGSACLIIVSYLGVAQYNNFLEMREFSYSRIVLGFDFGLNLIAVLSIHMFAGTFRNAVRRRGISVRQIAIQGSGETALALIEEFNSCPGMGYSVVGFVDDASRDSLITVEGTEVKRLGGTDSILDLVNRHNIEELVITNPQTLNTELARLVEECHRVGVVVKLVPDLYGLLFRQRSVEELAGMPVVQINEIAIAGTAAIVKRIEDIVLAVVALVALSPIMFVTAAAIRLDSKGPIFFRQRRIGKSGRHVEMYKYRSMYEDAEKRRASLSDLNESGGPLFKIKEDPRVTFVGRLIRRMCIDELPQLLNVLKGEMSLVGPRPLPVMDIQMPSEWEQGRFSAVPGITGMWQVNRLAHTPEEMLKWDLLYIESWSLWLDFRILLKTIGVVLSGRGSY